jgi:hypothetical protein
MARLGMFKCLENNNLIITLPEIDVIDKITRSGRINSAHIQASLFRRRHCVIVQFN